MNDVVLSRAVGAYPPCTHKFQTCVTDCQRDQVGWELKTCFIDSCIYEETLQASIYLSLIVLIVTAFAIFEIMRLLFLLFGTTFHIIDSGCVKILEIS